MTGVLLNLFDHERAARATVDADEVLRIGSGLDHAAADRRTRLVLESVVLRPRNLHGVGGCVTTTSVLGCPVGLPVLGGPRAIPPHDTARQTDVLAAAAAAGAVQMVTASWEKALATADPVPPTWWRVGIGADLGEVERGADLGCAALVVDLAADEGESSPAAGWSRLERLADATELPVVAAGVLRAEDARSAREAGAAALLVESPPVVASLLTAADAVGEITAAVDPGCEVYLGGGVRRGIDLLKLAALGVRACVVDRPLGFAHALGGRDGLSAVYEMLREELRYAMETCGVRTLAEAAPDLVHAPVLVHPGAGR